ncbi:septum site-determining protein MinC [Crenothrix polyspora]|jgi:septum site-determining protein MinC|uniref:Probable septum site-determining protein MinC n=1 Tax=Crenothrix polyspora TaxID=360316 RepID=A0A1R4GZ09_9GAMM|nr:septum site-determining protein MinC [Crenothrix polyspora]SJM89192.1 putative septum site-determining protein MinC [Crenothrix polyspora]
MSTDNQTTAYNPPVLEFKSSSFSVPALILSGNELKAIEQQLQEKIKLAPEFFKNSPVIIDLKELTKQHLDIDIALITEITRKLGLLPIGIRGGSLQQNKNALALRIPVYSNSSNRTNPVETQKTIPATQITEDVNPSKEAASSKAMIITQPIRSGQRIYAQGDLIILAQVSAGAEILAEGNIHIYGALRGRALAGVQGNTDARIFCTHLQAELISIAGNYKISEDLTKNIYNKPVHIYLKDYTLVIKEL